MLEGSFFRDFPRGVNHIEAHDGLTVSKRGLDVVDDRCVFENALGLFGQAEIGADDFCLGIFILETFLGSRRMADQPEAPPLFDEVWKEGAGLFATCAGDDEKILRMVDGAHAGVHGKSALTRPKEDTDQGMRQRKMSP